MTSRVVMWCGAQSVDGNGGFALTAEFRLVPPNRVWALQARHTRQAMTERIMRSPGLSLHKARYGLGYLLKGLCAKSPFAGQLLVGADTRYGPPLLCPPLEVALVADALATVDDARLRAAFDAQAMLDDYIHPMAWHEPGQLNWLIASVHALRGYVRFVASQEAGMISFVT